MTSGANNQRIKVFPTGVGVNRERRQTINWPARIPHRRGVNREGAGGGGPHQKNIKAFFGFRYIGGAKGPSPEKNKCLPAGGQKDSYPRADFRVCLFCLEELCLIKERINGLKL